MSVVFAYTYTVRGTGLFPFDMLRYDRCTPKTEADSSRIEQTTHRSKLGPQEITMLGTKEPTVARWESFGWRVKDA